METQKKLSHQTAQEAGSTDLVSAGKVKKSTKMHRYNLELTKEMFDEVKSVAANNGCSVVEMLKKFIKIGLIATGNNTTLIIRRANVDTEIIVA